MTYRELLTVAAAQLRPNDLVLLLDGDRRVHTVIQRPFESDGKPRVTIFWTDDTSSVWLADSACEIVR